MSTTYLLDKLLQGKKLNREKLRLETISRIKKILGKMAKSISFKRAYLFGTVTKPYQFFEESDVDIGFIGLEDRNFFKALAFLSRELERDVDIVQLEKFRLKEKILREGLEWKKRN